MCTRMIHWKIIALPIIHSLDSLVSSPYGSQETEAINMMNTFCMFKHSSYLAVVASKT